MQTISATASAISRISKPKKANSVSHAKPLEQTALPLPAPAAPEFGELAVDLIIVRDQVRTEFDEDTIAELAADIAARGILQPLAVRRTDAGFVLVAGERRLRAAKLAALPSVPVLISDMNDQEHAMAQLAENIQREDLSLADEAKAISLLYEALGTVKATAEKVNKSVAWVSKRVSLANGLGHYAGGLLADGITEDLELILSVDKLDKATPGSNSAWALCEKIRAGKAGRTEAREALKMATTRKEVTSTPATDPKPELPAPHPSKQLWYDVQNSRFWWPTYSVSLRKTAEQCHVPEEVEYLRDIKTGKLKTAVTAWHKMKEELEALESEINQDAGELAALIKRHVGKLQFEAAYDLAREIDRENK
ncbi:MAG: plasmid-partitioning protein ParB [Proteobacteria bacterium]|nr:plasmid-partitioning protein ParB [Pseudomonadota bacterium]